MAGGRKPRDKGSRAERALVRALVARGLAARRVPLSGAAAGYPGDVVLHLLDVPRIVEVKCRADGFRELYSWLENRDLLVIKADRRPALVVVPIGLALEMAEAVAGT